MRILTGPAWAALVLALAGCGGGDGGTPAASSTAAPAAAATKGQPAAAVDATRLSAADEDGANWMSYGRNYAEQRFSPLSDINADNVAGLKLAWYFDLDNNRGVEATPLVVDGVMYTTASWSVVYALDAATGELKWKYDPAADRKQGFYACCDVVNRGVAVWDGKVFVGVIDGRLIALDAATGKPAWEVQTTDTSQPYTITGAPRVVSAR